MSKTRDKVITVRVDEDMYNIVKKMAADSGQSLSEYIVRLLESTFDQNNRMDLLIRNMHEEILQLADMITLMQGFNMEVFRLYLLEQISQWMKSKEKNCRAIERRQWMDC